MSLPYITVNRLRRQMVHDPMSDQDTLGTWDQAKAKEIERCLFAPATSEELPGVDIEQLSQYASLYMPFRADVNEHDRIIVDQATWEVVGRPSNWDGGGHGPSGSVVRLHWLRDKRTS